MQNHIVVGGGHNQGMSRAPTSYSIALSNGSSSTSSSSSSGHCSQRGHIVVGGGHLYGVLNRAPEHTHVTTLSSREFKQVNAPTTRTSSTTTTPSGGFSFLSTALSAIKDSYHTMVKVNKILSQIKQDSKSKRPGIELPPGFSLQRTGDSLESRAWAEYSENSTKEHLVECLKEGALAFGSHRSGDLEGTLEHGMMAVGELAQAWLEQNPTIKGALEQGKTIVGDYLQENWQHLLRDPEQSLHDWQHEQNIDRHNQRSGDNADCNRDR